MGVCWILIMMMMIVSDDGCRIIIGDGTRYFYCHNIFLFWLLFICLLFI